MIDKIHLETKVFKQIDESDTAIEKKLQELEMLFSQTSLNSEKIKYYKERLQSLDISRINKNIDVYQQLDQQTGLSNDERLGQLINLLAEHPVDSTIIQAENHRFLLKRGVIAIIAVLMIFIGFAMIVLPAPAEFEMFTVYYFNNNDGVTLMDLISLLIIFCAVFLLVTNMKRKA